MTMNEPMNLINLLPHPVHILMDDTTIAASMLGMGIVETVYRIKDDATVDALRRGN